ncbi:hypothetical protein BCR34DRAFT_336590 [Clohesyomyces aquaticus]|uniref:Uncharacterized protein n=1 Tax=Clohesyomyces aquaticus TaxID=1231657 RepID=A0A1Y1ZL61_9PLEO|nr:hypothetical protein BCR34DRAFT_336590 [Clohesyomyces aquaticus]
MATLSSPSPLHPVFKPFTTRPPAQSVKSSTIPLHALIRDQFTITTWLLLGALLQAIATLTLPYRNILIVMPVFMTLSYKLTRQLLILCSILPNPRMAGVVPKRVTPVYPSDGTSDLSATDAASSPICALLIAAKSNSSLGLFQPAYKPVADRFDAMVSELNASATENGYLGSSSWLNACDRATGSEIMTVIYFQNEEYLHDFAHGPTHSEATLWWRELERAGKDTQVGIMHEVFACPKRSWEGIYVNYQPTGMGATTKEVKNADGTKSWVNPLVKVKGKLNYSKGRMGRAFGANEWDIMETMTQ